MSGMKNTLRLIFKMSGPDGTPYLTLISTIFSLAGVYLLICRPRVFAQSSTGGGGGRAAYGSSAGTTLAGDEYGEGGSLTILIGITFFSIGLFFYLVGYRVTKEREEESPSKYRRYRRPR